jgi:hypothetical protein
MILNNLLLISSPFSRRDINLSSSGDMFAVVLGLSSGELMVVG